MSPEEVERVLADAVTEVDQGLAELRASRQRDEQLRQAIEAAARAKGFRFSRTRVPSTSQTASAGVSYAEMVKAVGVASAVGEERDADQASDFVDGADEERHVVVLAAGASTKTRYRFSGRAMVSAVTCRA